MQYITSLLSSTPPPPATTPLSKVRVDSPVVEVEYTTACSTLALLRWFHLLLTSPKGVPQVVRRRSLTPRVKSKTLLNPLPTRMKRSSSPDLPRKGEYISNISLSQKRFHQTLKTHPLRNGPIETS